MRRFPLRILPALLAAAGPPASAQQLLGSYTGHETNGNVMALFAAPSAVRVTFLRDELVRVDFLPGPSSRPDSSFVVTDPPPGPPDLTVVDAESTLTFGSSLLTIVATKFPLRLRFLTAGGQLLAEPSDGGLATQGGERQATFTLAAGEHLYGTGGRGPGIDRRGRAFECYNRQVYGYSAPAATMNINIPLLLSSRGYGLYFDSPHRSWFDVGASRSDRLLFRTSGGELTYYLFHAPTLPGLLDLYAGLTGRAPLPPRWAFGYIQSKYGYRNEAEARATVDSLRSRRIPADALVLDTYWFRHMGDLQWNSADWPAPFLMMSSFRARGIRTILITEPYFENRSLTYGVAAANGWLGRTATGQPYPLPDWWSCGCTAGLLDMTHPDARAWFWGLHPPFLGNHVAGLWTDLGEPERHPDDMWHTLGPAPAIHNVYNSLWAKTVHDGFLQLRPGERVFNLTRSGFAGVQRYGVTTWSGDVARTFGGLAAQPGLMLSMGLSGLAYHGSDIGGFCCGTTTPELYIRWMQLGAFSPLMRAHGTGQPTEPWAFGPDAETICRRFIELRYELLPYTYTLAAGHHRTGLPLARPLLFADPADPALADETSAFTWGDDLLVAPVLVQGGRSVTVPVPQGRWVDFWTDTVVQGGSTQSLSAPLERIPLLVRSGSIIPLAPVMQHTEERPLDTLRLAVYPLPGAEARFTLYEDDGLSLGYTQGAHAATTFRQWFATADSLTDALVVIGATEGTYAGRPERRVYRAELHGIGTSPVTVRVNGRIVDRRSTPGDLRTRGDGWYFDTGSAVLFIQAVTVPDSSYLLVAEGLRATGVKNGPGGRPGEGNLLLEPAYPNPFNPGTEIGFRLSGPGHVRVSIYDVLGRVVDVPADGYFSAGRHAVRWAPQGIPSGAYFAVVRFDGDRATPGSSLQSMKIMAIR